MMRIDRVDSIRGIGTIGVATLDGPEPSRNSLLRRLRDGALFRVKGVEWWAIIRRPAAGDVVGLLLEGQGVSVEPGDELERAGT